MLFKGTDKLSAFEIAKSFENMGAMINAFTSKDCTCYFTKSVTDSAEKCFESLCHIFFDSTFPEEEIAKERNVVIEEINMVEDAPEEVAYDLLADSLYDGSLSQTILGPSENILRFTKQDMLDYINLHYVPENTVVAFAGQITLSQADKLIKKYFLPKMKPLKNNSVAPKNSFASKQTVKIDDYEQSNLLIGFPSIALNDKLTATQALLSVIMGGGMSSRLFQRIREQMGLAYSIYTNPTVHVGTGSFNICVNYTASNTSKVLSSIKEEIALLLKNGIVKEEFDRAKAQLKSSMVFSQENVQSQMLAFGKLLLLCDELYDMDKRLKEIEKVTVNDLMDFAKNLFSKAPALAYLGKQPDIAPEW
jgi:predicted Zn-dependent peptidase